MRSYRGVTTPNITRLVVALSVLSAVGCSDPVAPARAPATTSESKGTDGGSSFANNNIYELKVYPEGMGVGMFFKFYGNVTPILAVGTGPDVYATQKTWAAAKSLGENKYYAHVGGLESGKLYYYRLESLGGTPATGSFKTLRRQVIVDIDWIQVEDDGDLGASCGDFFFRAYIRKAWDGYSYTRTTHEYCVHSGYGQGFMGNDGRWVFDDWEFPFIALTFGAFDNDSCYYWSFDCGDIGYSIQQGYDISKGGTHPFKEKTYGSVHVTFEGKITVNYIP